MSRQELIIEAAVNAVADLVRFSPASACGVAPTRDSVAAVLVMWRFYEDLTAGEVAAVLARFAKLARRDEPRRVVSRRPRR